jgi:hypothetical protein
MAIVQPIFADISGDGSVKKITWNLTTADTTGAAIDWCQWADRSVLFYATTWGTSTAVLEGSNDTTNFIGLADPQGTAISKTADAVESVLELTQWVRPRLSVPGTAAVVSVSLVCRRNQPLRT